MDNGFYCPHTLILWDNKRTILKMKTADALTIFSQIINFMIFIYFAVVLLQLEVLDVTGLLISAFGLLSSLIASIASALKSK